MNKDLIKKYADINWADNKHMNDYIVKSTFDVIELSDGTLFALSKPSIQKRFCFHDEGPSYDLYKDLHSHDDKMKKYFFNENLKRINQDIQALEKGNCRDGMWYVGLYVQDGYTNGLCYRTYDHLTDCGFIDEGLDKHEKEPNWRRINEKDRLEILILLRDYRASLEKRLNTWWKKYGVKGLRTWTYWADA